MFELVGYIFAIAVMIIPVFLALLIIENLFKRR